MRALSDDLDLAETSGIDTSRVILWTWVFAAGFAGLAGVFAAALTSVDPELGFELLLPIFAAVVLGGIGDAFGALAAGIVLGLVIEWSTLFIDARWKIAIGFVVLILVLIIRPAGDLRQGEGDLGARALGEPPARGHASSRSPTSTSGPESASSPGPTRSSPSACSSTSASPASTTSARPGSWRSAPTRWRSWSPTAGSRSGSRCRSRSWSRSASASWSACRRFVCGPTTSRSRRSPRRRRSGSSRSTPAASPAAPERHLRLRRRLGLGLGDDPGLDRRSRLDRRAEAVSPPARRLGRRRRADVRAQPSPGNPLGPRAASDPRGRGRGPGAGQERLLLQAPVAGDLGDAWRRSPASSSPSTSSSSSPTSSCRSSPSPATRC